MQLINIYAHSGNAKNLERDELFERDLMFYLRYNIANSYVAEDNLMLTENITIEELEKVISSTANKKSPGIDGIPFEFYKTFWDTIKYEFYQIIHGIIT